MYSLVNLTTNIYHNFIHHTFSTSKLSSSLLFSIFGAMSECMRQITKVPTSTNG